MIEGASPAPTEAAPPVITEYGLRGQRIIRRAAEMHGMAVAQLISGNRRPRFTRARFAVMLALHRLGTSTTNIGRRVNRDHSTVVSGLRRARELCETELGFSEIVDELIAAASCTPPPAPAKEDA